MVSDEISAGQADRLCADVAARVDGRRTDARSTSGRRRRDQLVRLEVVTVRYDAVGWFAGAASRSSGPCTPPARCRTPPTAPVGGTVAGWPHAGTADGSASSADRWPIASWPRRRRPGSACCELLVGGYATVYLLVRLPHCGRRPACPTTAGSRSASSGRPTAAARAARGDVPGCWRWSAGVGFTLGWRWRLTGPLFGLAALASFSFGLSWGHILHTEHLLALHLLVLALAPAADACSLDARSRARRRRPAER